MVDRLERLTDLLALLLHTNEPLTLEQIRERMAEGSIGYEPGESGRRSFERDKSTLRDEGIEITVEYQEGEVGAAAVDYLRVAGHLVFGYFFARMAQVALREIAAGNTDPFYPAKLQTARFYFAKLFPETATLMRTARAGAKVLMDTELALA